MYFWFRSDQVPIITHMNRNITSGNWKHFSRTSEEFILYILHDGVMYLSEETTRYILHAGDVILLQPGLTHVGYRESDCDFSYIHFPKTAFVPFDTDEVDTVEEIIIGNRNHLYTCNPFSNELYEKTRLFIPKQMHIDDSLCLQNIRLCMESAIRGFDTRSDHYKLECSCKAIEILIQLSSTFATQLLHEETLDSQILRSNAKVQAALTLLHQRYAGKLSGQNIAAQLDMNFDYLNRLFKRQMGITIFQYLNVLRINKAKEMLINGNLKSSDIAVAVGLGDEYRFCKVFKKMVGITPRKYLM